MNSAQLRAMRETCGLSQQALADLACVSRRTVVRWERGQFPVPDDVAAMLEDMVETIVEIVNETKYQEGMSLRYDGTAFENATTRAVLLTAKAKGFEPRICLE